MPCVQASLIPFASPHSLRRREGGMLRWVICSSCFLLSFLLSFPVVDGLEKGSPLSFHHLKQPLQLSTKGANKK